MRLFPTASMIKVPIMLTLFQQVQDGRLGWLDTLTYRDSLLYAGEDDLLGKLRDSTPVPLAQVAMLMITTSDNTASLWLQKLVGTGTAINAWLAEHGFDSTRVNSRTPGREDARTMFGWGQTTPREMAELLVMIRQQRAVSPAADQEMYRMLTRIYWNGEALSQVPPWVQAASKQGAVDHSRSEVMLVNAPSGDYVFSVITKGQVDSSYANDNEGYVLLRKVSALLWSTLRAEAPVDTRPGRRALQAVASLLRHRQARRDAATHHLAEGPRDVGVHLGAGTRLEVSERLLRFPGIAIGPVGAERIVDVAHVHDAAGVVAVAGEAERGIAPAVDADVVLVGHHRRHAEAALTRQHHAGTLHRVRLDHQALLLGELARLRQDLLRDPDLAQVVQQSRHAEAPHFVPPEPQPLRQSHREHRHVAGVGGGVLVEPLEVEQREEHAMLHLHRDRERAHDRLHLAHRQPLAHRHFVVDPVHGRGLVLQRQGTGDSREHREPGAVRAAAAATSITHQQRAEADRRRRPSGAPRRTNRAGR